MQRAQMKMLLKHLFLVILIILVLSAYILLDIRCPFKYFLGITCPTCGMTRSLLSLTKLDLAASLNYNPMTVFMIAAIWLGLHKPLFRNEKAVNAIVITLAVITFVVYLINIIK